MSVLHTILTTGRLQGLWKVLTFFHIIDRAIEPNHKNLILTRALLYVLQNKPTKRNMKAIQRASMAPEVDTSGLPPTDLGKIEARDSPPIQARPIL